MDSFDLRNRRALTSAAACVYEFADVTAARRWLWTVGGVSRNEK